MSLYSLGTPLSGVVLTAPQINTFLGSATRLLERPANLSGQQCPMQVLRSLHADVTSAFVSAAPMESTPRDLPQLKQLLQDEGFAGLAARAELLPSAIAYSTAANQRFQSAKAPERTASETSPSNGTPPLPSLKELVTGLKGNDASIKRSCVLLSIFGKDGSKACNALLPLLGESELGWWAATAMAAVGHNAVHSIAGSLDRLERRFWASFALAEMGETACGPLVAALRERSVPQTAAFDALHRVGANAVPSLKRLISTPTVPLSARMAAVSLLGQMGADALPALSLLVMLCQPLNPRKMRTGALSALGALAVNPETRSEAQDRYVGTLRAYLADPSQTMVLTVLAKLEEIELTEIQARVLSERLMDLLSHKHEKIRNQVVLHLQQMPPDVRHSHLQRLQEIAGFSRSQEARKQALSLLKQWKDAGSAS
jgi:hypothetical protein